ncbi:hypothetical protein FDG50_11475 [Clostridium botulinum]|nr:hypothetical protein [Clostridium botulinum]NFO41110.1 hypothetical protein [Clostridium botulinum]NFQ24729.1 hypothetical protein [Clostridium botulinum]
MERLRKLKTQLKIKIISNWEKLNPKYKVKKYKITKYFNNNREDLWFLGAIISSFLFILIKFGLLYTLPLATLVCVIRCIIIVYSKLKGGE